MAVFHLQEITMGIQLAIRWPNWCIFKGQTDTAVKELKPSGSDSA